MKPFITSKYYNMLENASMIQPSPGDLSRMISWLMLERKNNFDLPIYGKHEVGVLLFSIERVG